MKAYAILTESSKYCIGCIPTSEIATLSTQVCLTPADAWEYDKTILFHDDPVPWAKHALFKHDIAAVTDGICHDASGNMHGLQPCLAALMQARVGDGAWVSMCLISTSMCLVSTAYMLSLAVANL